MNIGIWMELDIPIDRWTVFGKSISITVVCLLVKIISKDHSLPCISLPWNRAPHFSVSIYESCLVWWVAVDWLLGRTQNYILVVSESSILQILIASRDLQSLNYRNSGFPIHFSAGNITTIGLNSISWLFEEIYWAWRHLITKHS